MKYLKLFWVLMSLVFTYMFFRMGTILPTLIGILWIFYALYSSMSAFTEKDYPILPIIQILLCVFIALFAFTKGIWWLGIVFIMIAVYNTYKFVKENRNETN